MSLTPSAIAPLRALGFVPAARPASEPVLAPPETVKPAPAKAPAADGDRLELGTLPTLDGQRQYVADMAFREGAAAATTAAHATRAGEAAAKSRLPGAADFAFRHAALLAGDVADTVAVARSAAAHGQRSAAEHAFHVAIDRADRAGEARAVGRAALALNMLGVAHEAFARAGERPDHAELPPASPPAPTTPPHLRDDTAAWRMAAQLPALAAQLDMAGLDARVLAAADRARSSRVAGLIARAGFAHGAVGAADAAYRMAAERATHYLDALAAAHAAAQNGLGAASDHAYRRAADLARFSNHARHVAFEAAQQGQLAAAGHANKRAAQLPPAPPPPPPPPKGK